MKSLCPLSSPFSFHYIILVMLIISSSKKVDRLLYNVLSYSNEVNWNMTRSEVSKISIMVLMNRCEYILSRFLTDENILGELLLWWKSVANDNLYFISHGFLLNYFLFPAGEYPLPKARLEEIIYVLQKLAQLLIHPDVASILPLHSCLKTDLAEDKAKRGNRFHLFVLLPSFCELVTSR
jgi:hypothetical protein